MINVNLNDLSNDNNEVTINGRVINSSRESKEIEKRKVINSDGVENIYITSFTTEISVFAADSSEIEAHVFGEAILPGGNLNLNTNLIKDTLYINLDFTGIYVSSESLHFDVFVPEKIFKKLVVESVSANIELGKNVSTKYLLIKSASGNIDSDCLFETGVFITSSGNIQFSGHIADNFDLSINSASGNINADFKEFDFINILTSSFTGSITNAHAESTNCTTKAELNTLSGNITIS